MQNRWSKEYSHAELVSAFSFTTAIVPILSIGLVCLYLSGCDTSGFSEKPFGAVEEPGTQASSASEPLMEPDTVAQPSPGSASEPACASGLDMEALGNPFELTSPDGPDLADATEWISLGPVPEAPCPRDQIGVPLPLLETDEEEPEDLDDPIDINPKILEGHRPVIIDGWTGSAWLATQPPPSLVAGWSVASGDPQQLQLLQEKGAEFFGATPKNGAARSVYGTDNRTLNTNTTSSPWLKVAALRPKIGVSSSGVNTYADNSDCSAAFIGPRHVLTAAHCVWNDGALKKVRVVPAQNGSGTSLVAIPFGTYWVKWYYVPSGWKDDPSATNVRYDYALLVLGEDPDLGWLGFGAYPYSYLKNVAYEATGYPGNVDESFAFVPCANSPFPPLCHDFQYTQSAQVEHVYTSTLKSKHDSAGGQSGSPLWRFSNQSVRGILTKGGSTWTLSTRIRTGVFDYLCEAIHENPTSDNHGCY